MKIDVVRMGLALPLLFACQSTPSDSKEAHLAQSGSPDGMPPGVDAEIMQQMMAIGTPAEPHAELAKGAGSWDVAGRIFMAPGAPPMEMQATAEVRMILGGRFLVEDFRGEMMGEPFVGMLILGYNNMTEEYESVWVDNHSTGLHVSRGQEIADGTISMGGTMRDVRTPEGRPYRHVSAHHGDDAASMQMFDTLPDGSEWMVMELAYTRR